MSSWDSTPNSDIFSGRGMFRHFNVGNFRHFNVGNFKVAWPHWWHLPAPQCWQLPAHRPWLVKQELRGWHPPLHLRLLLVRKMTRGWLVIIQPPRWLGVWLTMLPPWTRTGPDYLALTTWRNGRRVQVTVQELMRFWWAMGAAVTMIQRLLDCCYVAASTMDGGSTSSTASNCASWYNGWP